ncbi:hypothetical protein ACJJTC_000177 [Scirpophaga incertulas]
MKVALCVLLLATALVSAEEKKNEKRGVLGLGYGHAPVLGGYYGHGLGLYNHGISSGIYGSGLVGSGLYGHGVVGSGLIGHGLVGSGIYGHGIAAPVFGHGYGAPLPYSAPLLGLGHGWH